MFSNINVGVGLYLNSGAMDLNNLFSWTPMNLFSGGKQGHWSGGYEPSNGNIFQDSLGSVAALAGTSVGSIIDKSQGDELGPECVVPSSWAITAPAGTTGTNSPVGTLSATTNGSALVYFDQSITTVVGKTYKMTFTCGAGNVATLNIGTTIGGVHLVNTGFNANGSYQLFFVATTTTTYLRFIRSAAGSFVISNISVKTRPSTITRQNTTLSRPTLARLPKVGRRNLVTSSVMEGFGTTFSTVTYNSSADPLGNMTAMRVTRTTTGTTNQGQAIKSVLPVLTVGKKYTLSAVVRDYGYGAIVQNTSGLVVYMAPNGVVSGNVYSAFVNSPYTTNKQELGGGLIRLSITATVINNNNGAAGALWVHGGNGASQPVGAYTDYCWPQFEEGDLTPYQHVISSNNVSEPGALDMWHLINDGNDSLPNSLAAGTYGRAWIDFSGNILIDSVTNPSNILIPTATNSTQVDVIFREGAFTADEKRNIRKYWNKKYNSDETLWNPNYLFDNNVNGFWPGGYNPVYNSLWQDSTATTLITSPNNPVGYINRLSGSVDTSQSTALSRPTLARLPKGGRRNLLVSTNNFMGPWTRSNITISGELITANTTALSYIRQPISLTMLPYSTPYYYSVELKAGTVSTCAIVQEGNDGGRLNIDLSNGTFTNQNGSVSSYSITPVTGDAGWYRIRGRFIKSPSNPENAVVFLRQYGAATAGDTLYMRNPQVELDNFSNYQRVVSQYDVTETGIVDMWHLINDGNDSMNLSLSNGTYGRAWIDFNGNMFCDTVENPNNSLIPTEINSTQVDVIFREGAFTSDEITSVRKYWTKQYNLSETLWNPNYLFDNNRIGYWSGGYNPSSGRLWQDSTATTLVTQPSQSIGRTNRLSGSADASQSTALSRPTLTKWPKGGRKNYMTNSLIANFSSPTGDNIIAEPTPNNRIDVIRITPSTNNTPHRAKSTQTNIGATSATFSFVGKAGGYRYVWFYSQVLGMSVCFDLIGLTYLAAGSGQTVSITALPDGWCKCVISRPNTNSGSDGHNFFVQSSMITSETAWTPNGTDYLSIGEIQLEYGNVASNYQRVSSQNDVTETGKPDIWHLTNDGNDSLPITLPAGTYGVAWVDNVGNVTVNTVTNPTNVLIPSAANGIQADVIIRQGAFTSDEINKLTLYWKGIYQL